MLNRFKPVAFEPAGQRRRKPIPRWLVLLLGGIVLGAGGVLLVQERYLPPRLSAEASTRLQSAFEQAEAEVLRLGRDLADTKQRLDSTVAENKGLTSDLASGRESAAQMRSDLVKLMEALPPDPRGGSVAVRSGRFVAENGSLTYDVVLSRERAGDKPFEGVMQLVVRGVTGRGAEATVNLEPVHLSIGLYDRLTGSLPLPAGFKPSQTTINVLDRAGGRPVGTRVMFVR